MVCPVCREPLTYDVDQLLSAPEPQLPEVRPPPRVLLEPHWRSRRESRPVLSGGRGGDQLKLQAEVERAPEAAGEAEVERRNHRPGGRVQPLSHPHQRGERRSRCRLTDGRSSEILKRTRSSPFVDPDVVDSLRLLLKTEAQTSTGRPDPPPVPQSSLRRDCPTVEAVRPTGSTGEEAGPGHSTGEAPPSQSTSTRCVCLQAPRTNQRKPTLRVATSSQCKRMLAYVRTGVFLQSTGSFQQRGLQTGRLGRRQPLKVGVREKLQTTATVAGEEVLTGLCPAAGLPGLPTTGTQKVPETEEEGGTTGDTAGASSTKWWTGSGAGRRCYDKEPLEGLSTNVCVPPSSD